MSVLFSVFVRRFGVREQKNGEQERNDVMPFDHQSQATLGPDSTWMGELFCLPESSNLLLLYGTNVSSAIMFILKIIKIKVSLEFWITFYICQITKKYTVQNSIYLPT
jgi:hypothetical protein